jgi:uncharacterized Fe-S cluster protein YjdI
MDLDRTGNNDREYTNGEITVFWKPSKCIHATTCYRELIEVFNPRKRPWVNMDGASTEEIIRVVGLCPTEALTYKMNHGRENSTSINAVSQKIEATEDIQPAELRVMKDGPLVVKGNFIIRDSNGQEMRKMKMASFCRCGHSANMPFCDGTHRKIGFSGE